MRRARRSFLDDLRDPFSGSKPDDSGSSEGHEPWRYSTRASFRHGLDRDEPGDRQLPIEDLDGGAVPHRVEDRAQVRSERGYVDSFHMYIMYILGRTRFGFLEKSRACRNPAYQSPNAELPGARFGTT